MTLEQWALVLTAIAAWVALGISLYNLWQGRPKREVKVDLIGPGGEAMRVSFINKRGPGVVIEEVGFEYADGSDIVIEGIYASEEVLPGHRRVCHYNFEDLRGEESPVKIFFRDATGQKYRACLSPYIKSALVGE